MAKDIFARTLEILEGAFRLLESRVPAPTRKPWKDGFVFRYAEQTVHQAIVQKLARIISGLHALNALLDRGLFQEQGMIQRALDELEEDIAFLSFGVMSGRLSSLHTQYLDYFYAEEFDDPTNIMGSHRSRGMVKREKIRAYVNRQSGAGSSRGNIAGKIIAKAYSGFVHAASPHIMDMCGGKPPRFDVSGEFRNVRHREFADDAMNYFYRALVAMAFAAKAFGDEDLFQKMRTDAATFEVRMNARRGSVGSKN
jgi:hypothetical protein